MLNLIGWGTPFSWVWLVNELWKALVIMTYILLLPRHAG